MPMRHVARCDSCGAEKALKSQYHAVPNTQRGYGLGVSAYSFTIPDGWRDIDGKTLCSWECVAAYAGTRLREARDD